MRVCLFIQNPESIFFSPPTPLLQGPVLYGHYGEESDFMMLQNMNLNLTGRVLLLRAGRNSFAEKVRAGPSREPSFPAAASCSRWFPPPGGQRSQAESLCCAHLPRPSRLPWC